MGDSGIDRTPRALGTTDPPQPTPPGRKQPRLSRRRALSLLGGLVVAGGTGAVVAVNRSGTDTASAPSTPGGSVTPTTPGSPVAGLPVDPTTSIGAPPIQVNDVRPPLPDRAVSMWIYSFTPPTVRELPIDVVETINLAIYAMAQSAAGGTGTLKWEPHNQSYDDAAADVASLIARGTPVLLGVGGSDDGGITLTNDEQAEQFCASIRFFVQTFGFTGIDIDLEPSGSSWTAEAVVTVARTLKEEFGRDFLIGLTVGLYGEYTANWLSLANMLGDDYDYWAPMLYDYPEAHDERLIPDALKKIAAAVDGGVPASKQILGFMCNAYYNSSPVPVTAAVWEAAIAKYPDLRGAFIWESKLELASDYEWTRALGVTLRAGS